MELAGVVTGEAVRVERATFQPAWWCRNAHLQTIWAGILRHPPRLPLARARWELPDGDFLDVDQLAAKESAPRLVVLHGLESSSRAAAVLGLLSQARQRGWGGVAINFRGCSGQPNRLRRSYHGGDTADLAWVIARVRAQHPSSPIVGAGFSLGGNVLLKYLGEQGEAVPEQVRAAAAISAPFDLAASVRALEQGFSRVYQDRLVATLKRKTFEKLTRHPDLVDRAALRTVRTLRAFDGLVTAPVHSFSDAAAYWAASSSAQFLPRIRRPTLLINAEDDPFLPAQSLPRKAVAENPFLTAAFPAFGGHIGFLAGRWPGAPTAWAEERAAGFLAGQLG
ncbi:MAG: hydrolase [Candidatus Omnitrophica bacterium]|nr:hydrolase [Candidatus Omnitrophota bacterium]